MVGQEEWETKEGALTVIWSLAAEMERTDWILDSTAGREIGFGNCVDWARGQ